MADPTGRCFDVLALLQSHPRVTAAELAAQLDVTERTARRDVARLRGIGYRIDATPGRQGGYVLVAGTALPPLALNHDEALAIALGLRASVGVGGLGPAAVQALAKLTTTAPARLRAQFEAVAGADALQPASGRAADPDVVRALALACRASEAVRFRHRRDGAAHGRSRDAQPHRLVTARGRWYLIAHQRGDRWRVYAVDRISDVLPLGGRIPTPDPPADAAAFVTTALSVGDRQYRVRVRLHTSADLASELIDPTVGTVAADGDDSIVTLSTDDLDWIARWIIHLNIDADVIEPPELTTTLHRLGRFLAARYTPTASTD